MRYTQDSSYSLNSVFDKVVIGPRFGTLRTLKSFMKQAFFSQKELIHGVGVFQNRI